MNRHQVLTGAANNFDYSLSIGSVENTFFTAYGSGSNLVILSSSFERIQILSGSKFNNSILKCVECTFDTGKIAAAYDNYVHIFEPTPSIKKKSNHCFDYKWIQIGSIKLEANVTCLSWNPDSNRLLFGLQNKSLQIWSYNSDILNSSTLDCTLTSSSSSSSSSSYKKSSSIQPVAEEEEDNHVKFSISDDHEPLIIEKKKPEPIFKKIWEKMLATPIKCLKFSPDGLLFASFGENDRIVKVWHEVKSISNLSLSNEHESCKDILTDYDFIYLSHPRSVTNISWRKISRYMPKGFVANSLLTSCKDNVCRIWSETILSDDGLTYCIQEESESSYTSVNKSSRQKRKLFNKIQKMSSNFTRQSPNLSQTTSQPTESKLTYNLSCNELSQKNFSFCNLTQTRLHFHLAGFVDIDNGPSLNLNNEITKHFQFNVHWLNNKNLNFTLASETFFNEIRKNLNSRDESPLSDQQPKEYNVDEKETMIDHYENSKNLLLSQAQDQRLDKIIKDWYSSQDLLYCINPIDGSVLIWLIDWLDEHMPGTYRQPQVSFHAKLPNTMPVGDAFSLTNSVFLYSQKIKKNETKTGTELIESTDKLNQLESKLNLMGVVVNMVSKHSNGTLNLWRLQFQENSKYQSLVNVTHLSRVCGHRFRVSDISSHPILPFLLTNSINDTKNNSDNVIKDQNESGLERTMIEKNENFFKSNSLNENQRELIQKMKKRKLKEKFQKGLIIWGVDPVGPLSISGGIYELARVDSSKENAFENIAWFPCFLPSFTLGTSSSSPSTLFVSSDCSCITIYQAVFDARTLLHDLKQKQKHEYKKTISTSSSLFSITTDIPYDNFNVISIQSTARPGCIIELDKLIDSNENWSKADLFHVYQEDLIKNVNRLIPDNKKYQSTTHQFNETYYLVLLEKNENENYELIEMVHMWRINVSSAPVSFTEKSHEEKPKYGSFEQENISMYLNNSLNRLKSQTSSSDSISSEYRKNRISITSTRVCRQELKLPNGVYVVDADSAAADLSSSSMFTLSQVPYLFSTACSDGIIRFWSCKETTSHSSGSDIEQQENFTFFEWKLNSILNIDPIPETADSQVQINDYPLALSCSYNGRFAVAYKKNKNQAQNSYNRNDSTTFTNFYVLIYECESTGGSAWNLEGCISLENIILPELDIGINFNYISGNEKPIKPSKSSDSFKNIILNNNLSSVSSCSNITNIISNNSNGSIVSDDLSRAAEIPSAAAKISIKKKYLFNTPSQESNKIDLIQSKKLVKLDWASSENGSHILTVCLGNQVFIYSCVKKESGYSNKNEDLSKKSIKKSFLYNKNSNIVKTSTPEPNDCDLINTNSLVKWVQFRSFTLDSADDMQALPNQIKWVRDGLLIVGLNTEMQVFSQWSPLNEIQQPCPDTTHETGFTEKKLSALKNHSVMDLNKLNKITNQSFANSKQLSKMKENEHENSLKTRRDEDEDKILDAIQDSGLFMQAKNEWPVLPQYHPKQLLELMNSGKINRVKAILMHLTRCIIDCELNKKVINVQKKIKRKISVCSESKIPEGKISNYLEIESIPPLPLYALFAADTDSFVDDTKFANKNDTDKSSEDLDTVDFLNKPNDKDDLSLLTEDLKLEQDDFDFDSNDEAAKRIKIEKKQLKEKTEFKKSLLSELYSNNKANYFNSKICKILIEYLNCVSLNGLNETDQMCLLAIADTVANVRCDLNFESENIFEKRKYFHQQSTDDMSDSSSDMGSTVNLSQTVDNCGLKFLLAVRSFNYLIRTLPINERDKLKDIGTANYAWAFHSECEQELLNSIPLFSNNNSKISDDADKTNQLLLWPYLRQYGIGWWLKNIPQLRTVIERVAKCSFQLKNDPLDAAIFFLAMKKKGVLCALFKSVKDTKMSEFFKNDFNETKWQTAALKNAFVLLGKQRFEHAAAFFLLSGRLKDAIEVCIRSLKDIQLALIIIRLYESDIDLVATLLKKVLCVEILGYSITSNGQTESLQDKNHVNFGNLSETSDSKKVSNDPFLRSMSYWVIKDYKQALNTLYEIDFDYLSSENITFKRTDHLTFGPYFSNGAVENNKLHGSIVSDVFNFYTFIKNHPLVLRHQMVEENQSNKITKFSSDDSTVTPFERRLHFFTAYFHLVNGCPLLTLDVLSKLPKYVTNQENISSELQTQKSKEIEQIKTDQIDNKKDKEKASDFDWSSNFDSVLSSKRFDDEELVLDLKYSDDDDDEEEEGFMAANKTITETIEEPKPEVKTEPENNDNKVVDMFAQQMKFIACLKILIEEMSTLATGFEVIGGQLRFYLYYWLERETHVLRELGDYKYNNESNGDASLLQQPDVNKTTDKMNDYIAKTYLLHEQVLEDQKSFHDKIERLNRRKEWLRSNELLLRTFLSYCSLHSAKGGGLISIKMELALLMQELIEDRSMKQLLLPVPVPTTIPLLSACVASSKNVIAGPIRMIKSMVNEILRSISSIQHVPTIFDSSVIILTAKDQSLSLSSCIYQCLCDSDSFNEPNSEVVTGMQGFSRNILYKSTYLMFGAKKKDENETNENSSKVHTNPKNWPGISNLTKLLDREQDIEAPKLKVLLFESLVSVYSSLLLNAFVFYDCFILVRILNKQWNDQMWNSLFGGGCLREYKYKRSNVKQLENENDKQRMKINAKLGLSTPYHPGYSNSIPNEEEKVYFREDFVPPEMSIVNFFINKKHREESMNRQDDDIESDDEEINSDPNKDVTVDNYLDDDEQNQAEHMNPQSYSWCLMRLAVIKLTVQNITSLLNVVGIDMNELAIVSPYTHDILKALERWIDLLRLELSTFDSSSINNNLNINLSNTNTLQSMLNLENTPFINEKSTYPIRKLWVFLIRKKILYDDFIYYTFKRKNNFSITSDDTTRRADPNYLMVNPCENQPQSSYSVKLIHKDPDAIHGFCLNERDKNMLALCTNREILEIDIKSLKSNLIDDDLETDYPHSNLGNSLTDLNTTNPTDLMSIRQGAHSTHSSNLIIRRNVKDVRRLASHPTLPYYLSGTNEGVVKLWHWGSNDALSSYKQVEKSASAKITKLLFNNHGNKFGVSDMDGYLHLYQLLGCSFKSYMTLRCFKVINDFLFIDSSSLLLTIGASNDSYIISIWDTLLPPNKSLIKSYKETDVPSGTCAAYSPLNHFAYCGNKKGEVNIYDVRTHKKIQKFTAHESSVKAIALDPDEYYIATGSSEGNIKIWNLKTLEPIHLYHNEHSKSSIIRNLNSGVNQLYFTHDNQILSCGLKTLDLRNISFD